MSEPVDQTQRSLRSTLYQIDQLRELVDELEMRNKNQQMIILELRVEVKLLNETIRRLECQKLER